MDIEKKALELVYEVSLRRVSDLGSCYHHELEKALCRAIEQHEAFRREVSDAVEATATDRKDCDPRLWRFIIPQPDPLDGVIYGAGFGRGNAELLREAADRLGYRLELVKKEPSQ